jgi:hypothetical protein
MRLPGHASEVLSAIRTNLGIGASTSLSRFISSHREGIAQHGLVALALFSLAESFIACSRSEPEQPPVAKTAIHPTADTSLGTQRSDTSHEPQPTATASPQAQQPAVPPDGVASFLQPVGMAMTPGMDSAARWLEALRVRNKGALSGSTQFPFEWLDASRQSCSAKQPAAGPEELSPILDCLLADPILQRALGEHDRAGIAELPSGHLQEWAQPLLERAPVGATLVNAFIKRSDIQLDMDLWVTRGAVQALWTKVVDGSSAINIARRWLDALQKRDLRALAEVTGYPFEVRDTGREAVCGKRFVAKPEAFESAVKCLFRNEELIKALESGPPFVEAAGEDYSIPNWAEHWWQAAKHGGLSKISAGVTNPVSFSFDLILMVAPEGVRAFWKLGSLESRD